jgi:acyl-CoA thioesterase
VNSRRSTVKSKKRTRVAKAIWEFLAQDKFAESLGIKLLEMREGYAKCAMIVRDEMVNVHGIAHGAAIFALADYAFAAACNAHGQTALALEVKINFLDAVKPGTRLVAEAEEEALSERIGLYHLTARDESGTLVAAAQATAYRKKEWFHKG